MTDFSIFIRFSSILILSIITSICVGQNAPNITDANGKKQGLWEKFYENDSIMYRATFKDDIPVGTMQRFYEEGGLQAKINYVSATKNRAELYYPDSLGIMAKGNYINQVKDSLWIFYAPDGSISAKETYKMGKKNGTTTVYYPDGSVLEKIEYKDDVKNGLWEQYFEDGNPKLKATVVDGISYEGEYISYYANGSKFMKGKYLDGRKTSSWYHFHENGSIEIIYVYRYGKVIEEHRKNGKFEGYYPDDIKEYEYTYKNGKKHGPFVEYYHQGDWKTEEALDEFGNKREVQKLHNTQVKRSGSFYEDELHGEIKMYNEKGKLTKTLKYNKGELVK